MPQHEMLKIDIVRLGKKGTIIRNHQCGQGQISEGPADD
jgi:hypothetical protein